MNYDSLVMMIHDFGYAALFFALWLGIVGIPIPDEVIVMTGGAVTANGILLVIPAFLLTYLGVISGLSLGYVLGRTMGEKIVNRLRRRQKFDKYFMISDRLVQKYGRFALSISYILPIVRHVMPYLVGLHRMKFRHYALFAYTSGLIWTLTFFTVGRLVGKHIEEIGKLIYNYGVELLVLVLIGLTMLLIIQILKHYRGLKERG